MKSGRWIVLSLLLIAVFFAFVKSPIFRIKTIDVRCDTMEEKKKLEGVLQSFYGKNLFEFELSDFISTLLHENPRLKTVLVRRRWPSTLIVQAEERKAIAMVFRDQELWLVDGDGIAFEKGLAALPLYYPTPNDPQTFRDAMTWAAASRLGDVNGLAWDRDLGLVVEMRDHMKILLGDHDYPARWSHALESRNFLRAKGMTARRIDATYNNRAVITL